jgi:hypothetical protein
MRSKYRQELSLSHRGWLAVFNGIKRGAFGRQRHHTTHNTQCMFSASIWQRPADSQAAKRVRTEIVGGQESGSAHAAARPLAFFFLAPSCAKCLWGFGAQLPPPSTPTPPTTTTTTTTTHPYPTPIPHRPAPSGGWGANGNCACQCRRLSSGRSALPYQVHSGGLTSNTVPEVG